MAFQTGNNKQGSPKSILEHIQSYEIIDPIWLHPLRHKRSAKKEVSVTNTNITRFNIMQFIYFASNANPVNCFPFQHPAEVQVLISAEGQELQLHLEKNEWVVERHICILIPHCQRRKSNILWLCQNIQWTTGQVGLKQSSNVHWLSADHLLESNQFS